MLVFVCTPLPPGMGVSRLAPEVGVMLVAGFETSAATMGWCLHTAARHPEVQARVQEELAGAGLTAGVPVAPFTSDASMYRLADVVHQWMDAGIDVVYM